MREFNFVILTLMTLCNATTKLQMKEGVINVWMWTADKNFED